MLQVLLIVALIVRFVSLKSRYNFLDRVETSKALFTLVSVFVILVVLSNV